MDANSRLLRAAFDAAVAAARPERWLDKALAGIERPRGRTLVIALGKGSLPMARVFADRWGAPFEGVAITPRGTAVAAPGFHVLEAAHPVPDEASLAAGEAALGLAAQARAGDLVILLLSGGASALACAPIEGVSLARKAEVTRRLLASGLPIEQVNAVRQALSRLKAGGLLCAAGEGRVATIAQSDVPLDNLRVIGSAPGVPVEGRAQLAVNILAKAAPDLLADLEPAMRRYEASLGPVSARWEAMVGLGLHEPPTVAADVLSGAGLRVNQSGEWNLDAAAAASGHAEVFGEEGEDALVSWGETTVAVPGRSTGRGGRNQHFLLSLAVELAGRGDVWALAADTDGVDGTSPAAGAWIDPVLLRSLDVGEARAALAAFDAYGFFARHGRLVETGPTGVNVGDLRLLLVDPKAMS